MTYLKFHNRPLCDHMGCMAGIRFCEELNIRSCSYRTQREARAVIARVNKTGWAGALSIGHGECPRMTEEG